MLRTDNKDVSILLTGSIKCNSAHECLTSRELSPEFWARLKPEEIIEKAKEFGLSEKTAIMLSHGFAEELRDHYKKVKYDLIPKEKLFDWFLNKQYKTLKFDTFKFKSVIEKKNSYYALKDADYDSIHTHYKELFPWCKYQENSAYKKTIAYSQRNEIDTKIRELRNLPKSKKSHKELIHELVNNLYIPKEEKLVARMYLSAWFTGLIHRSLNPGAKFDLVLVLNGEQGAGKTTFLENIFPKDTYVMSNSRDLDSKDKLINLSTNSVVIWDEIGSFSSKYMTESIKQFLTICQDSFRPVYGRETIVRGRRCVFAATTNDPDILDDLSGSRRFMVVTVGDNGKEINNPKIKELMPYLLSATLEEYEKGELKPYFNKNQIVKQNENNERYAKEEPIKVLIEGWIASVDDADPNKFRDKFTTLEMAQDCLNIAAQTLTRSQSSHYGKVLRNLGYKNKRVREGKILKNIWIRQENGKSEGKIKG